MLQKTYRLPAAARFKNSVFFNTSLFSLKLTKNNLDYSRFGFVVSKNVNKRSTARNKIKRLFRSCIEEMLNEIQSGRDMLFFLKRGIVEIDRKELYNQIYVFLKNKNLLK